MPFVMQQMRTVIERFPDTGDGFRRELEAIEANVETTPHICLGLARGLLESCCKTIQAERGEAIIGNEGLPDRAKREIERLKLGFDGHPEANSIEDHLTAAATGLNDAVVAIARLSNVQGLRHGGDVRWTAAGRDQALFLASTVDALAALLYEAHRRTLPRAPERAFEDEAEFNVAFDEQHIEERGDIIIAGVPFRPSEILWTLNRSRYDQTVEIWRLDGQDNGEGPEA